MELTAAGWTLTGIHLDVVASVPRAAQCDFIDAAVRAKTGCSISRLLQANVSMSAKMKRGLAGAKVVTQATSTKRQSIVQSKQAGKTSKVPGGQRPKLRRADSLTRKN
jgi:hypothetical protein